MLTIPCSSTIQVRFSIFNLLSRANGCVGHGGQTKDLDGDEDDGYDEVIYPVDFRTAGHIVDDEMHRIMYVLCHRNDRDVN